jgi:hypothetical protein
VARDQLGTQYRQLVAPVIPSTNLPDSGGVSAAERISQAWQTFGGLADQVGNEVQDYRGKIQGTQDGQAAAAARSAQIKAAGSGTSNVAPTTPDGSSPGADGSSATGGDGASTAAVTGDSAAAGGGDAAAASGTDSTPSDAAALFNHDGSVGPQSPFGPLTGWRAFTTYGKAYNNASMATYIAKTQLDARDALATAHLESMGDLDTYDTRAAKIRETVMAGVPQQYQAMVANDIDGVINGQRKDVLGAQIQNAKQDAVNTIYALRDSDAETYAKHVAGTPGEQAWLESHKAAFDSQVDSLFAAHMIHSAKAAEGLKQSYAHSIGQEVEAAGLDGQVKVLAQPMLDGNMTASDQAVSAFMQDQSRPMQERLKVMEKYHAERGMYEQNQANLNHDAVDAFHTQLASGKVIAGLKDQLNTMYNKGWLGRDEMKGLLDKNAENGKKVVANSPLDAFLDGVDSQLFGGPAPGHALPPGAPTAQQAAAQAASEASTAAATPNSTTGGTGPSTQQITSAADSAASGNKLAGAQLPASSPDQTNPPAAQTQVPGQSTGVSPEGIGAQSVTYGKKGQHTATAITVPANGAYGPVYGLDPSDKNVQQGIDVRFQKRVAANHLTPFSAGWMGVAETYARAGIVPKSFMNMSESALASGDPQTAAVAAGAIHQMQETNPAAFHIEDGKQAIYAFSEDYYDRLARGQDPRIAYQQAQDAMNKNTPEITDGRMKVFENAYKVDPGSNDVPFITKGTNELQTYMSDKYESTPYKGFKFWATQTAPTGQETNHGQGLEGHMPPITQDMAAEYVRNVRDNFMATGNLPAAKALGLHQIDAKYGISTLNNPSGEWMPNPPDRAADPAVLNHDKEQMVAQLNATGKALPVKIDPAKTTYTRIGSTDRGGTLWGFHTLDENGNLTTVYGPDGQPAVARLPNLLEYQALQQSLTEKRLADAKTQEAAWTAKHGNDRANERAAQQQANDPAFWSHVK